MPSIPIPIDHPNPSTSYPGMSSNSPSSTISISPQTPFYPPPGLSAQVGSPPTNGLLPSSPPRSGFFKWATASLGKSPPVDAQRGFDIPNKQDAPVFASGDEDHGEHHDSFEFGDFDDMKSRSLRNTQRRAVSMSGPSGITSMLSGFGATSPPLGSPPLRDPFSAVPASVPTNSVLAENAAKGQSVLRRLSMSGSFRPAFLGPPTPSVNQTTSPKPPTMEVQPQAPEPPRAEPALQRATTITGAERRGRRYSDSGKKRGVSPMGERLLRDHGHF